MKVLCGIIFGIGLMGFLALPCIAWSRNWPEPRYRAWLFAFIAAWLFGGTAWVLKPWLALGGGLLVAAVLAKIVYWPSSLPIRSVPSQLPQERVTRPRRVGKTPFIAGKVLDVSLFDSNYIDGLIVPVCISLMRLRDDHDTTVWIDLSHEGDSAKCALYLSFSCGITQGVTEYLDWWRGTQRFEDYRENCLLPLNAVPVFKRRATGVFVRLWPAFFGDVPETCRIETDKGTLEFLNAVYIEDVT